MTGGEVPRASYATSGTGNALPPKRVAAAQPLVPAATGTDRRVSSTRMRLHPSFAGSADGHDLFQSAVGSAKSRNSAAIRSRSEHGTGSSVARRSFSGELKHSRRFLYKALRCISSSEFALVDFDLLQRYESSFWTNMKIKYHRQTILLVVGCCILVALLTVYDYFQYKNHHTTRLNMGHFMY